MRLSNIVCGGGGGGSMVCIGKNILAKTPKFSLSCARGAHCRALCRHAPMPKKKTDRQTDRQRETMQVETLFKVI